VYSHRLLIILLKLLNMRVSQLQFEALIFKTYSKSHRYTQDSPVYPDVWLDYFNNSSNIQNFRADLILIPHRQSSASELFQILQQNLEKRSSKSSSADWLLASNGETVAASLTLDELLSVALPLTNWWQNYLWKDGVSTADQVWLQELVGAIYYENDNSETLESSDFLKGLQQAFLEFYSISKRRSKDNPIVLWSVSRNRMATVSIEKSVPTTKADSGRRLFDIDGSDITWAVLDTGIDARHRAFLKINPQTSTFYENSFGQKNDSHSNHTRIVATYDFSRFREILADINSSRQRGKRGRNILAALFTSDKEDKKLDEMKIEEFISEIERDLKHGRMLDWSILSALLRIPHNASQYVPPVHPHGTHVAGILGANLSGSGVSKPLVGMCPKINLYDIRVLGEDGKGSEFNILAAIQFIRWMNSQRDGIVIHGVNLSLSLHHEVASYACGQTPVCDACERLVAEGTIVVAAAGNLGQTMYLDKSGQHSQGFRIVNITDPGNADNVITVGATHRDRPHSYGVSYFSSKGPTGDGRIKPDIVAPGEKIVSTSIDNTHERMDGTSMAAPHVSGAAALLIAKHKELIGKPKRVKEILCKTATDLGREKYFQGCGMVDVLRAIQYV
jgi:serine protease AprX